MTDDGDAEETPEDCDRCGDPVASSGIPLGPLTTVCHLCWVALGTPGGGD